jgi:hypothetical protein
MKKQLLLFAFSALALTSCSDDDIQGYEMDMMKGDWKISKREVVSGKDDKTVISTYTPTGCEAKNNTYFGTDYSTTFTSYSGVGANCNINGFNSGTYSYDTDTKNLVINYDNDSPRKYQIVILTSSEMRIKQMYDNIDQNGDLVPDAEYVSYKR